MSQLIFSKCAGGFIPGTNKVSIYAKTDGELYIASEDGIETKISQVSGRASLKIEPRVITKEEELNKEITLQASPLEPNNISLIVGHGGGVQIKGESFEVTGRVLYWRGKELDGFIEEGDVFILHYLTIV